MFGNNLIKKLTCQKKYFLRSSICVWSARPQNATVQKWIASNSFAMKQRQNCCQNISHDTLRVVFVVENQRGVCEM